MDPEGRPCDDTWGEDGHGTGVGHLKPRKVKDCQQTTEAGRGKKGMSPGTVTADIVLTTP